MNGPYELTEAARELLAVEAERDRLAARVAVLEAEREAEKKRALEWIEVQDERGFTPHTSGDR